MKEQFLLDPNITYLNFGSFGACPKPVFEAYQQLQLQLEQSPVQFIVESGMELLKASRHSLQATARRQGMTRPTALTPKIPETNMGLAL